MGWIHGYTLHSYSPPWMPKLLPGLPELPLKLPTPDAPSLCTSSGITTSFSSSSSSASGLMLSAQKPHPRQQRKLSYSVVSVANYKVRKSSTYASSDEEWPLKGVVDMGIIHGFLLLHFVDQVRRVIRLHVEEHQPKIDTDAGKHRAEVSAAQIEFLIWCISHFLFIN